jgi:transcriptional regulator with XRE-family HTH domain
LEKPIYSAHQEAFRKTLIALRKAAGLTQRQLAQRLRRVPSVIAHIEQGQRRVDTIELYEICKALGISPERVAVRLMRAYQKVDKATKR